MAVTVRPAAPAGELRAAPSSRQTRRYGAVVRPRGSTSDQADATEPPIARCDEPPSAGLLRGIEQFNRREYFECHETLEALWNAEPGPIRALYKGILQVGVGCYHLLRENHRGALIKLQSGADHLERFAPRCLGVEVGRLIADARRLRAELVALGADRLHAVDLARLPEVRLTGEAWRQDRV
jgi:uncharacterized protein